MSSASYNAQGQLTQLVNENPSAGSGQAGANGLTRQWSYETNTLRLSIMQAGTAAPFENLQKLSYGYDNAGNITTLTDGTNSSQVQTFGYDWLNRLTSASTNGVGVGQYNHSYTYDAIGNITSFAGNAYTYGDPAHKHAVTAAFGNNYAYDANGNQTSRTIGGVTYTFAYDYENRLTAISGGGVSASFTYDADGERVEDLVNGVTTVYIAGVYEYQGGATTLYYEGNALRRSGYASDNGVFYLLQDHLKSSSAFVTQSGTAASRNYFFPFGGNRGGTAFSDLTTKRFTGQYHEASLPGGEGLSYYGARWYDAKLGRFLSADTIVPGPANPQAFNRYSYVVNNPLRFIDPDGHTFRSALDLIRKYAKSISSIAKKHNLDSVLLAGVVFAENRNDYNWIRGQDWSSIFTLRLFGGPEAKNLISPLVKNNPSIGITEVSVAVAAMMDHPELVPDDYADMSREERATLHEQIAVNLSKDERKRILNSLSDPEESLEYAARYLNFLAKYRDYGTNYALWLSDYNRGLSDWQTTTEYGRRVDDYRENIEHALNWEPIDWVCVGRYGCGAAYDRLIYGRLP